MILVIGGLNGFIGSNTTEALVELGYDYVVTCHENKEVPRFLDKHVDQRKIHVEQADATSLTDSRKIGEKHRIDGLVNVAGGFRRDAEGDAGYLLGYLGMLESTFKVAQEWNVKRITFSSTVGFYLPVIGVTKIHAIGTCWSD